LVASKKHPEVHLPQSFTIWTLLEELITDISNFSGIDKSIIIEAFECIMMKPGDANMLKTHTSDFRPLIIDVGNGFVLRPISAVFHNPYISINQILEHRNKNYINDLSLLRE
jgi:hypothetical protein